MGRQGVAVRLWATTSRVHPGSAGRWPAFARNRAWRRGCGPAARAPVALLAASAALWIALSANAHDNTAQADTPLAERQAMVTCLLAGASIPKCQLRSTRRRRAKGHGIRRRPRRGEDYPRPIRRTSALSRRLPEERLRNGLRFAIGRQDLLHEPPPALVHRSVGQERFLDHRHGQQQTPRRSGRARKTLFDKQLPGIAAALKVEIPHHVAASLMGEWRHPRNSLVHRTETTEQAFSRPGRWRGCWGHLGQASRPEISEA